VKNADNVIVRQDQGNLTPLLQAATRGHLDACAALITAGADVNLTSNDGWAALHKASANGHAQVVGLPLLVRANRHVQYQDGVTPLHLAEKNKHEKTIALLKGCLHSSDETNHATLNDLSACPDRNPEVNFC